MSTKRKNKNSLISDPHKGAIEHSLKQRYHVYLDRADVKPYYESDEYENFSHYVRTCIKKSTGQVMPK